MYNKIRFDTFMLMCFFMITILGLSACDSDEKITQEPPSQTYVKKAKEILAGDIEKVFDSKGGAYLESYTLFDIYEGAQIKPGYKSIAYSLTFRAKDKNLEEADLSGAMNRIVKALEAMKIELRA